MNEEVSNVIKWTQVTTSKIVDYKNDHKMIIDYKMSVFCLKSANSKSPIFYLSGYGPGELPMAPSKESQYGDSFP